MSPDRYYGFPDRVSSSEKVEISLKRVTRLEPHGMCGGVIAAVNFTEILLNTVAGREPVYTFNPVVHNHKINQRFQDKGLVVINERTPDGDWPHDLIPPRSLVLNSAHGHRQEDVDVLEAKGCIVFNTVCSLVVNSWGEVEEASDLGKTILFFGKPGHPESRGTVSHAYNQSPVLISRPEDIDEYVRSARFDPNKEHVMVNQTTTSIRDIKEARQRAIDLIPRIDIDDKRGGCYATDNRQKAAEIALMTEGADALLVVGSGDISNNTRNLAKVAWDLGKPGWIVNHAGEIDWNWFALNSQIEHLALTSGASCEEEDFEGVFNALGQRSIGIHYQEPIVKERKTEFPIPDYEKISLLSQRYADGLIPAH